MIAKKTRQKVAAKKAPAKSQLLKEAKKSCQKKNNTS
jgi:hypothetical protein